MRAEKGYTFLKGSAIFKRGFVGVSLMSKIPGFKEALH